MSHHGRNHPNPIEQAAAGPLGRADTKAVNESTAKTQVNQSVTAGAGKHRGDQRDRSPTYTNNERHAARGNTPRKDVSTRAR